MAPRSSIVFFLLQGWRLVQKECAAVQIERCFAAILDRGQRCCNVTVFAAILLASSLHKEAAKSAAPPLRKRVFFPRDEGTRFPLIEEY
jgi:hypothetical protein